MVGGWQRIKNQSGERMAPGGGGLHVKPGATSNMGQGFTVVVAFLFFVSFFLPLCSMSQSLHVCLWFNSLMPWPAPNVPLL